MRTHQNLEFEGRVLELRGNENLDIGGACGLGTTNASARAVYLSHGAAKTSAGGSVAGPRGAEHPDKLQLATCSVLWTRPVAACDVKSGRAFQGQREPY